MSTVKTACACPEVSRDLQWQKAPNSVSLEPGQVDIWRVSANESNYALLRSGLSDAEYAHAQHFASIVNRYEFIVARSFIRFIIGRYLAMPPHAIRFRSGQHGKPELEYTLWGRRLRFNVSHSHEVILAAITFEHEVGIDVEQVSPKVDFSGLASIILSPAEESWLLQSQPDQRQLNFFRCWTRKEAFAKGLGKGIADGFHFIEVIPSRGQLLPRICGIPVDKDWSIRDLEVDADFVGAIATACQQCSLRLWDWPATGTDPHSHRLRKRR